MSSRPRVLNSERRLTRSLAKANPSNCILCERLLPKPENWPNLLQQQSSANTQITHELSNHSSEQKVDLVLASEALFRIYSPGCSCVFLVNWHAANRCRPSGKSIHFDRTSSRPFLRNSWTKPISTVSTTDPRFQDGSVQSDTWELGKGETSIWTQTQQTHFCCNCFERSMTRVLM